VIRVESAARPCVTRMLPPWPDGQPGLNRSGYFNQYNQGKLSLTLDLKQPEAVAVAKELVARSDIVCENFAAGVMDRMGLGYAVLREIKPEIIMIALSGYGNSGPEREFVSYGPAQVPLSGMSSLTGYPNWPPMHVGISYGDPTGGLHGAFAVLAALWHRQRTGRGQFIDLSQQETTIAVLPEGVVEFAMNGTQPARDGNRDHGMAPHGIFRCEGDQRWIAISVRDDSEWQRFARAIGQPDLAADPSLRTLAGRKANEDRLEAIVAEWTGARSTEAATELLQRAGVPAFGVCNSQELAEDPQLNASGLFVCLDHPEVGRRQHVGIPWRMSDTPCTVRQPAPCLGQHTDQVLRDVLGYSIEKITRLKAELVVH